MRIVNWIKENKLATVLLIIVLFLLFGQNILGGNTFSSKSISRITTPSYEMTAPSGGVSTGLKLGALPNAGGSYLPPSADYAPQPDITDRKVIEESQLSIQVRAVREAVDKIQTYVQNTGGYMVTTSLSNPGEAPSGNITVRVPQLKFEESLSYFRSLGIKVVWENLTGRDVTDQYSDLDAQLVTLNKTKAKFDNILDEAVEVSDILNINREIINIQRQIDSVKGQQNYLEKSAQMAKVTIYLSTDEFSLPYAPSEPWRIEVIFKQAVRSLVSALRKIGTLLIWAVVWSVIWVPLLTVVFYLRRRKNLIK